MTCPRHSPGVTVSSFLVDVLETNHIRGHALTGCVCRQGALNEETPDVFHAVYLKIKEIMHRRYNILFFLMKYTIYIHKTILVSMFIIEHTCIFI